MITVDVHVLTLEETPKEWLDRCVASIEEAARQTALEVSLFVVPTEWGNLGKSRAEGYSKGTGEYVTYADDDDWVEPNLFVELEAALEDKPQRVSAGDYVWWGEKWDARPDYVHCPVLYRRDWLETVDYATFTLNPDAYLRSLSTGPHISKCLYRYIRHDSPGSRLLHHNKEQLRRECRIITEILNGKSS